MNSLDEINRFLRGYIKPREDSEVLRFAEEHLVPIISPEVEQFLRTLLLAIKPKNILEIGTAIGYSALFFREITDAEITTIEISDEMADIAEHFTNGKNIKVMRGDAGEVLPKLGNTPSSLVRCHSPPSGGEFDFIFLDSSKSHYGEYLDDLVRLLTPGGILVCDNVLCRGLVMVSEYPDHKHRTTVMKLREFLENLVNREELETSILPIGDGISVSVKKGGV